MTKIGILVAIVFLFILFFRAQGWFIRRVAETITAQLVMFLVRLVMALVTGWVIYILITMIGIIDRIRSVDDIFTILQARPSQIGGSATIGLAIGIVFALFTLLHWNPHANQSVIQGQTVRFETLTRRVSIVGWVRRIIQRRIR
jgi:hypothetical protein